MKELYCLNCPTGCLLNVFEISKVTEVSGNGCDMGREFAIAETTNATRTLTTTVRTTLPGIPVLPVRTNGDISIWKIMQAMNELNSVVVSSEIGCGDTVLEDIVGSGVRVIATSDIIRQEVTKPAGSDDLNAQLAQDNEDAELSDEEVPEEFEDDDESDSSWRLQGRPHIRR